MSTVFFCLPGTLCGLTRQLSRGSRSSAPSYWRVAEQRQPGLSERVSRKLMPFDDPRLLRRFFLLPGDFYKDARDLLNQRRRNTAKPVRAAQRHEQALQLELLQCEAMRRFNLASIDHETDFFRDERGRIVRLWISGDRTKNGIAIDTPIPPDMAKHIKEHLTIYRPHLPGASSPWLFPSPTGGPRSPDSISHTLGKVVTQALDVPFAPHMMRHILATVLYRLDPHNGVVVQRKLRHANIKTTERMYGAMSNAGSNEAWQREVASYRRADVARKCPKGRRF
jgi:integrase